MKIPLLDLAAAQVDLWYTFQDEIVDPALLGRYRRLLSSEEAEQWQRYAFDHLRHEYLVTRALCRATLSRYADVDPGEWTFERNEHGKPEISTPDLAIPLRFNLSNTKGLIACGVARGHDVGIDVEDMTRRTETVKLAERFFSAAEARALRALDPSAQRERFFVYWTLKESYIKARGMGLAIPLEHFSFHLDHDEIRIAIDPCLRDDPRSWQFELFRPSSRHVMAVAIRRGHRPDVRVNLRPTIPLDAAADHVGRSGHWVRRP